jgi:hypothetical protein
MSEPHRITAHRWYHDLWWWVRGVGSFDFRRLCSRCGRTGQAHYHWAGCLRFKRLRRRPWIVL